MSCQVERGNPDGGPTFALFVGERRSGRSLAETFLFLSFLNPDFVGASPVLAGAGRREQARKRPVTAKRRPTARSRSAHGGTAMRLLGPHGLAHAYTTVPVWAVRDMVCAGYEPGV